MPVTPAHTSGTSPGSTNTPSRWASIGLVDRPPPTHRSNPGVPSGPVTPTNEMSLISCAVHRDAQPVTVVLYLRGRFVNPGWVVATSSAARSIGLASRISVASMPATGHPRMLRGTSPQACWLDRPTDSSRSQMPGGQLPARDAHAHHEVGRLDLGVLKRARLAAADAGAALGVQAPPAEPAPQVGRVDRAEPQVGVPVDDARADVQPVVVFLEALGRVQRLAVAEGPL